jgi:hypothetical protein
MLAINKRAKWTTRGLHHEIGGNANCLMRAGSGAAEGVEAVFNSVTTVSRYNLRIAMFAACSG